MTDIVSKRKRSKMMSGITHKDTIPELAVRSVLHRAGYRFRLHRKDLPGRPDVVLPKYKLVIYIHGCFWHRHRDCKYAYQPKSRVEFWQKKFTSNVIRDQKNIFNVHKEGWRVAVVWECFTRKKDTLEIKEALQKAIHGQADYYEFPVASSGKI